MACDDPFLDPVVHEIDCDYCCQLEHCWYLWYDFLDTVDLVLVLVLCYHVIHVHHRILFYDHVLSILLNLYWHCCGDFLVVLLILVVLIRFAPLDHEAIVMLLVLFIAPTLVVPSLLLLVQIHRDPGGVPYHLCYLCLVAHVDQHIHLWYLF